MTNNGDKHKSLSEVHSSIDTSVHRTSWRKFLAFTGPAFLVSVGYMDPGNWATDIAGGSQFGYTLVWVLMMSNIMALLLQSLAARLGLVRGKDLAQVSREAYPSFVNYVLYILAEIAIAATDLAEVLGMAIGLNLLFGLPLLIGVAVTVLDTILLLILQNYGMRKMEAFIVSMIAIIGFSFLIEMFFAKPSVAHILSGFVPHLPNSTALYIAIGIIGATVMPHNLYLHSALVQTRNYKKDSRNVKSAIKFNLFDSTIALNMAFFVNAAILILSAAVFFNNKLYNIVDIQDAHKLLEPLLGTVLAPVLFAVALIAAGQSSTVTGTLAGQIVMEGYLDLRIRLWLRRLITRLLAITPAFLTILLAGSNSVGGLLILSQVILSLQLGFAVVPLIHFVSDKKKMGEFAIKFWVKIASWLVALIIVVLNVQLVIDEINSWMVSAGSYKIILQLTVVPLTIALGFLLVYMTFTPLIKAKIVKKTKLPHGGAEEVLDFTPQKYNRIAVTLDFSNLDRKTLMHATSQGGMDSEYLLVHVVETAGAKLFGNDILDYETNEDNHYLQTYVKNMKQRGYKVNSHLGFGEPIKTIPQIIEDFNADLLVMGAHGHKGIKDLIYGQTVNPVRHKVKIPVLVVS